jgi:hypothetical protein
MKKKKLKLKTLTRYIIGDSPKGKNKFVLVKKHVKLIPPKKWIKKEKIETENFNTLYNR